MVKHTRMIENNPDQNQVIIPDEFGISRQDLEFLMQTHNHDCMKELNETFGGLNGIEKKLHTNLLTGLTGDPIDLFNRKKIFGRNELPKKSSKSFFRLMFEALQDVTLIILIICSLISFGLAFYHSDHHSFEFQLKQHRKELFS
jgi:magnesium-transporting ATPase (P-type)